MMKTFNQCNMPGEGTGPGGRRRGRQERRPAIEAPRFRRLEDAAERQRQEQTARAVETQTAAEARQRLDATREAAERATQVAEDGPAPFEVGLSEDTNSLQLLVNREAPEPIELHLHAAEFEGLEILPSEDDDPLRGELHFDDEGRLRLPEHLTRAPEDGEAHPLNTEALFGIVEYVVAHRGEQTKQTLEALQNAQNERNKDLNELSHDKEKNKSWRQKRERYQDIEQNLLKKDKEHQDALEKRMQSVADTLSREAGIDLFAAVGGREAWLEQQLNQRKARERSGEYLFPQDDNGVYILSGEDPYRGTGPGSTERVVKRIRREGALWPDMIRSARIQSRLIRAEYDRIKEVDAEKGIERSGVTNGLQNVMHAARQLRVPKAAVAGAVGGSAWLAYGAIPAGGGLGLGIVAGMTGLNKLMTAMGLGNPANWAYEKIVPKFVRQIIDKPEKKKDKS